MGLGNLKDLNDYLFAQLDRLDNIDANNEVELDAEMKRTSAICQVSTQIVSNANVVLKAVKVQNEMVDKDEATITLLLGN